MSFTNPEGQSSVNAPAPVPVPAVEHQASRAPVVRQSRDRAQYVRQQKGHSLIFWLFIGGPVTLWIPTVYYSVSPNHYWHA